MNDPATAPRTELGRIIFGILYATGVIVLYGILSGRESVGTLPVWTAIVLGATLLSILIAEVSFAWRARVY